MKRDLSQVRRNIEKRKRERKVGAGAGSGNAKQARFSSIAFPQDEERHGYMPVSDEVGTNKNVKDTFIASFVMKSTLAAILFFGVAILVRMDGGFLEKPKQWTSNALTEEFPFATVNHWYQEKFGYPLALTPNPNSEDVLTPALPVNGTLSQTFQVNGQGIMITADEDQSVRAMEKGIVIFAGNNKETNKTVIIQHADKSNTVYGNLTDINVYQYQSVTSNEVIGQFKPSESSAKAVYFAIEKDNQYLDPIQVMQVDERP
ncbi:M23 family metallopeptidase [Aquibacillus koreensis]|uniref:M23 family metallopeptidase n=1 Tax=Aquibacillus koreensis TaxID=279446 RepID=A0A9X3WG57_9BACI|nr:M23 family metallopeptidase [Aquibacillus koreensis]MCT2537959.1 M23 family metallopeptidase [Aquibacillus koreensis]MDC3419150.1 M23 family metallopeptidase [Aquibacillus koreensis]